MCPPLGKDVDDDDAVLELTHGFVNPTMMNHKSSTRVNMGHAHAHPCGAIRLDTSFAIIVVSSNQDAVFRTDFRVGCRDVASTDADMVSSFFFLCGLL